MVARLVGDTVDDLTPLPDENQIARGSILLFSEGRSIKRGKEGCWSGAQVFPVQQKSISLLVGLAR